MHSSFDFRKALIASASALLVLLLVVPLLALVVRSIETRAWEQPAGSGIAEAILLSIFTTSITTIVTLLLGTPLAYSLARWSFPGKRLLSVLVELPIVLPPAVAGLALLVAFGRRGFLGPTLQSLGIILPFSTTAVIIAQIFISSPFYVRAAQVGFQGIDAEIEDAGRVDGAGGFALFWNITLPLSRRALAAGLALSWARALGEFGATILFAGSLQGRTQTMPLLVYRVFESNINAAIWTGLLLIGMALVALLFSQWLNRKSAQNPS
ncbi:MAG: ABC transporter permease [Chloroflexota bacterium]